MDRRQRRTRQAIFNAFNELLEIKGYNHITVQDIIDQADIGRSTFYDHFESKDDLLKEMCNEIYEHIFIHTLNKETSHDFSHGKYDLKETLIHLLYHIKDNKGNIMGLLTGNGSEVILPYFKQYLSEIFMHKVSIENIPEDYMIDYLCTSFTSTLIWWIKHQEYSPEKMIEYYYEMTKIKEA